MEDEDNDDEIEELLSIYQEDQIKPSEPHNTEQQSNEENTDDEDNAQQEGQEHNTDEKGIVRKDLNF